VGSVAAKKTLDSLKSAIDEFDFDTALAKLDELVEHCTAARA
jgi:hypothetical protein